MAQTSLMFVNLLPILNDSRNWLARAGINHPTPRKEFYVLLVNLSSKPFDLNERQTVQKSSSKSVTLMETMINDCEIIGTVENNTVYNIPSKYTRDTYIIYIYPDDTMEAAVYKAD